MSDLPDPPKRGVTRLFLLCHAATAATRTAAFPADEPIEEKGRESASALAGRLPSVANILASPAQAARQTASALSAEFETDVGLRDCNYGHWAGLSLDAVSAEEPEAVMSWLGDPGAAPHGGGESIAALIARVATWLEGESRPGGVLAVTHAAVMRAAVVHVLGAPAQAFWRIDVAPLSMFEFRRSDGRPWSLRAMRASMGTSDLDPD